MKEQRTSWRRLISEAFEESGESWEDVISTTLTDGQLDIRFDRYHGSNKGRAFTMWTNRRVYFPIVYDEAEWVESVSRDPDGLPTPHKGGE